MSFTRFQRVVVASWFVAMLALSYRSIGNVGTAARSLMPSACSSRARPQGRVHGRLQTADADDRAGTLRNRAYRPRPHTRRARVGRDAMTVSLGRRVTRGLEDAGLLAMVLLMIPLTIVLLGAPIAAVAWLIAEAIHRL